MPELPEVETLARGLQREVAGRRVLSVELGKTEFMDNPAEIERELPGTRIERVERYGKFMLLRLERAVGAEGVSRESALLVHLGMTGTMVPRPASEPRAKHTHLVALLEDGRSGRRRQSNDGPWRWRLRQRERVAGPARAEASGARLGNLLDPAGARALEVEDLAGGEAISRASV